MDEGRLLAVRGLLTSSCPGGSSLQQGLSLPRLACRRKPGLSLLFVLLSRGLLGCPGLAEAGWEDYCPPTPGRVHVLGTIGLEWRNGICLLWCGTQLQPLLPVVVLAESLFGLSLEIM